MSSANGMGLRKRFVYDSILKRFPESGIRLAQKPI